MSSPSGRFRCRRGNGDEVVDGFGDLLVHLGFRSANREAFGAKTFHVDRHDGGNGCARSVAINSEIDREFKTYVKRQCAAASDQVEYLFPRLYTQLGAIRLRASWLDVSVGNFSDEIDQLPVSGIAVSQRQRVALLTELDDETIALSASIQYQSQEHRWAVSAACD